MFLPANPPLGHDAVPASPIHEAVKVSLTTLFQRFLAAGFLVALLAFLVFLYKVRRRMLMLIFTLSVGGSAALIFAVSAAHAVLG